ncbi:MAG: MFS transporter [Solirubrobacterales bacterium]
MNRIALSRAITFSGGNAAFIALLFVLYQETDSASAVALGALASFAVPAVASPVAGWLGDRFDRRRVMVTSEFLGAVCFLLSAAVSSAPTELLILRVLASLVTAPLMPAGAASLPGIVRSQDELPAANAKLATVGLFGGLAGPLLAAVLIAVSGPESVFLFNAVTFLASAGLLMSIDADFRPARLDRKKGGLSDLAAGFRYLGRHRLLRPVTLAYAIIFVGVGVTAPAEVVLSTDFGAGATGFAALTCAFAAGGIAGAGLAGRGLVRFSTEPISMLVGASGALTVGLLLVGFAPVFIVVLAGMAVAGAADGAWIVAHENLVQRATPDEIRSRVFAAGEAVYQGGISIGTIGAGALIAAFGAAGAFRFGAVGSVVACVVLVVTGAAIAKISPKAPGGRQGGEFPSLPTPAIAVLPARVGGSLSQDADQRAG